jgi:hypothetical protein
MANAYDNDSNDPNEMTITGADPVDPGPRGVLAKFLKACVTRDEETARALLTVSSVDGFDIEYISSDLTKAELGESQSEGALVVIPTTLSDEQGDEEIPIVMAKEEDNWRVDYNETVKRLMGGITPEDMLRQMEDAIKE